MYVHIHTHTPWDASRKYGALPITTIQCIQPTYSPQFHYHIRSLYFPWRQSLCSPRHR